MRCIKLLASRFGETRLLYGQLRLNFHFVRIPIHRHRRAVGESRAFLRNLSSRNSCFVISARARRLCNAIIRFIAELLSPAASAAAADLRHAGVEEAAQIVGPYGVITAS